jgi:lipopolysaccharide heptosyltransferase II
MAKKISTPIRKILLLALSGLGDAVCYLPSLRSIRKQYPAAAIVVVTTSAGRPILESAGLGLEIIVYDRGPQIGFTEIMKMIWSLRRRKFDLVLSRALLNSYRIPLVAFLSGSRYRIGASSEYLSFLYNVQVEIPSDVHVIERYNRLLCGTGIQRPFSPAYPNMDPLDIHKESAMKIWEQHRIGYKQRLVGFVSGCDVTIRGKWNPALKCWGVEGYAKVASWLVRDRNCRIVMFGSKKEENLAENIASLAGVDIANLCGKTSVGELQWLIRKCDFILCNDTGIAHLAVALGTPVLTLFGPTDPLHWGPIGDNHRIIVGKAPCGPCYPSPTCDLRECIAMKEIDPKTSFDIIDDMLDKK